jgi:xylan 1,4-beta-xylosidase
MNRRTFLQSTMLAGASYLAPSALSAQPDSTQGGAPKSIGIRTQAGTPFPHVWEECAGSDRAVVGLREQWLKDLEKVKKAAGIKSIRFHGLFNDEMGVWPAGAKQPNFLYVDMVYDAMLDRGLKPFVELSFMPGALASGTRSLLWYRGNTTPPKDIAQWGELVGALAKHCVDRYGIDRVSEWDFEVWNEPNIMFWSGTQADYFELYRQSATAIRQVDKRLRVGGPATAYSGWVSDFLKFCASQQVPVDFVSTHIYPDDKQKLVFGRDDVHYPFEEVIPRALAMVREQINASGFPHAPLYLTEWSSQNPAFIAHTIAGSAGLAEIMSYWTFDSVYEELGVPKTFLSGTYGLLGARGIERPSFHTFSLLHKLGDTRLQTDEGPVLATRRGDGSLAILVWNLMPQPPGAHSSMGDPLFTERCALSDDGREHHTQVETSRRQEAGAGERNTSRCVEQQVQEYLREDGQPCVSNRRTNRAAEARQRTATIRKPRRRS